MAADDEKTPEPEPWADILADGLDAGREEFTFEFDPDEPPAAADAPNAAADATTFAGSTDDDAAQAWLTDPDDAVGPDADAEPSPSASDFGFDDAGGSSVEIGTGLSGIEGLEAEADEVAGEAEATDDLIPAVENGAAEADPWGDFGPPGGGEAGAMSAEMTVDTDADAKVFPEVAAAEAAAVAPVATVPVGVPRGAKPAPRKQAGGIGQAIGVAAGGAVALPIVAAILIWGLQQDPFGVTKLFPEQAAFLLPQKFRPGFKKAKTGPAMAAVPAGSPLDAFATTGDAPFAPAAGADEAPLGDLPMPDLADLATEEAPVAVDADGADIDAGGDVASSDFPSDAVSGFDAGDLADAGDTMPPGLDDLAAVAAPGLDSLPAEPPAPVVPPLDTGELDAALAEADALGEALAAVEDRSGRPAKLLLVQWYQAVARVAERLASLERTAADAGLPLTETPPQVTAFHAALVGRDPQAGDLARVAWDWLAYRKRAGDGIVLPVTFESARRLGPYWSATATLDKGDGSRRVLSIVSRSEPAAVAGDRLLVTGLVLGDDVIWAADWHATAGGAEEPEDEPAFEPAFEPAAPF